MSEGWRDIKTAPKDGRWLLLAPVPNKNHVTCIIAAWRPDEGDDNYPWVDCGHNNAWKREIFTHWQPLPAPPKETP